MRIGIDMRMAGTGEGIGRYAEELVLNLAEIDHKNQYFLIFMSSTEIQSKFLTLPENFNVVETKSKYYSWSEQISFLFQLLRLNLDLVHFPSFNAPILYPKKFVCTIHDLIHHHYPGRKKIRFVHRLAYRLSMLNAVKRSEKILTVSKSTKKDILKNYNVPTNKIEVIYEGVRREYFDKPSASKAKQVLAKYNIEKPYVIFVGAWRKYKNLERLAGAFAVFQKQQRRDFQLVLVGKIDPFYPEVKNAVFASPAAGDIIAPGFVPQNDLYVLYHEAEVFVLPSLIEGFGLIVIEAQASGTRCAVSDIPVLREITKATAVYFDPKSTDSIAKGLMEAVEDGDLSKLSIENAKRYNWHKTAEKTLQIYGKI